MQDYKNYLLPAGVDVETNKVVERYVSSSILNVCYFSSSILNMCYYFLRVSILFVIIAWYIFI